MENGVYTSLDIGTTSIKVVVAEIDDGQLNVIGVGNEESKGLKRGMIVDIDETVHAISQAVKQAEDKAGINVDRLIVGVPANGINIEPCHGVISTNSNDKEIGDSEVAQVVDMAISNVIPPERDLLSVTLEEFIVDGFDEINDPRGMVGKRIEMYGTVLSVPKTILHNIKKCVEKSGYAIQNLILQPQAMSQVALSKDERDFGIVQIDMGGGQTTVSAVHDDQVKFALAIQEGGEFISKDVSVVLNTSIENAEKLKREIGYLGINENDTVLVDVVGQDNPSRISESYIGEIIEARLSQIFEQMREELETIQALQLPGGVVISGGAASTPGVESLAEDIFEVRSEVYTPDFMGVRSSAFTIPIGLVSYEASLNDIQRLINHSLLQNLGISTVGPKSLDDMSREKPSVPEEEPARTYSDRELDSNEEIYSDNEAESGPSIGDKLKGFFSGFFD